MFVTARFAVSGFHLPLLQPDFSEKTKLGSCCSWVGREMESSERTKYLELNDSLWLGLTWREEALLPVRVVVEGPAVVPVLPVALVPAALDVGNVGEVGVGEGEIVARHVDVLAVGWHWEEGETVNDTQTSPRIKDILSFIGIFCVFKFKTYRRHTRSPGRKFPWWPAWSWPGPTCGTPRRVCMSGCWCSRWPTCRRSWWPGYTAPGTRLWTPHFVSEQQKCTAMSLPGY